MTNAFEGYQRIGAAKSFRLAALCTGRRIAAGALLFAIGCAIPASASAQLDAVLKNLLQNAIPATRPTNPSYRPAYPPSPYPGYPPQSTAPVNPGYPRRSAVPPTTGYVPQSAAPPNTGYPAYSSPPPARSHSSTAATAAPHTVDIAELQRMLNELGYDAGPADGAAGSRTVQAVRAFQRDHGESPSGEVSAATFASVHSVWYERKRTVAAATESKETPPRPSFDCRRAASPTEHQICGSPQLAQLDGAMSQAFAEATANKSFADQARLMAEQQRWLKQRNGCGADLPCIEDSIRARIAAIAADRGLNVDQPEVTPGPPNTTSSAGNAPAAAAQQPAQTSADVESKFETASAPEMIDLVRLLMAARPDLYRSDPAALAVYGMLMQGQVQRCVATLKEMGNELRRPPVISEAHRQIEAAIAAARRSPTKLFRISATVQLGRYDANAKEFRLPTSDQQSLLGGRLVVTPENRVEGSCHPELGLHAAGMSNALYQSLHLQLHVSGGDNINSLPMARMAAEAYLDHGREVTIEALVEATASQTELTGTVVAARAIDPRSHAVLHVYEPALFSRSQPAAAGSAIAANQQTGTIDFASVPAADLRSLLLLRMATRPSNYSDDDFALFWGTLKTTSGTRECDEMRAAARNEIRRAEYLVRAKQDLAAALAAAKSSAPQLLRFSSPVGLRKYVLQSRVFPLEANGYEPGSILPPLQQLAVKPPPAMCNASLGGPRTGELSLRGLTVSIAGGDKITDLPMDPDAAEARMSQTKGFPRTVWIEVVARMSDGDQGLKGQIIAARVLDSDSHKVLHVYDPALFAESGAASAAATDRPTGETAVAATRGVLLFSGLRYAPNKIDDKALAKMTRRQAQSDQSAYESAGSFGSGGRDHVFVFAVDDVRGRAIDFVAPMLAGKMRAFLDKTAAQTPTTLWTSHRLIGLQYDHGRQMFRLAAGSQILSSSSSPRGDNLRSLSAYARGGQQVGPETEARALYELQPVNASEPLTRFDRICQSLPVESTLVPQLVALDRVLELDGIPVDPNRAERVVFDLSHRAHESEDVQARVVMHIEGAAAAPNGAGPGVVLLARLESVAILDSKGREFARFPAEAFPLAADRSHAMKQAEADKAAASAREKQQTAMAEAAQKEAAAAAANEAKRKAAEDVRNAALAVFQGKTSGLDMLGIQLGASYADAEALIRKHMQVGWILTNADSGKSDELTSMRIFVNPDRSEYIALFDFPKHAAEKVIGVRRYLKLDKAVSDDVIEGMLKEKYGAPVAFDKQHGWDWGVPNKPPCQAVTGVPAQVVVSEGPPTASPSQSLRGPTSTIRVGYMGKDLSEFGVCRPQIHVYRNGEWLEVGLLDMRIYATLLRPDGLGSSAATAAHIRF
jgi:uncharacterized protein